MRVFTLSLRWICKELGSITDQILEYICIDEEHIEESLPPGILENRLKKSLPSIVLLQLPLVWVRKESTCLLSVPFFLRLQSDSIENGTPNILTDVVKNIFDQNYSSRFCCLFVFVFNWVFSQILSVFSIAHSRLYFSVDW